MNDAHGRRIRRAFSPMLSFRSALIAIAVLLSSAGALKAQVVVGGDFDICDFCGNVDANTIRLVGRSGFGTRSRDDAPRERRYRRAGR